jgi:hypothetical protein
MDIKRKALVFESGEIFLDIFSTNSDTLVPSLYQWVATSSTEIIWLLSWSFLHPNIYLFVISKTFATKVLLFYAIYTYRHKQVTFLYKYPSHWAFFSTGNRTTKLWFSVVYFSCTIAILTTETIIGTFACASATPTLSWRWTVLLPSDT